jgi:radical SAM superfamily enzyme YgiQ (UPF0313 family)
MGLTRVTFIHCPNRNYSETQNNGVLFMPVWAYTLASHIPDDGRYSLSLCDTRFDRLSDVDQADIFLFSGLNQDYPELKATQAELSARFPQSKFILGGPIAWSFAQAGDLDSLLVFDHVVIGDGEALIEGLLENLSVGRSVDQVIRNSERFDVSDARPLYRPMMDQTIQRYYGAVLEVSRGCPFLCEFCDIRVLPDNNRAHNKPADLLIQEIDHICSLGVSSFLLACDNFISDPKWAEDVVDRILAWREKSSYKPVFFTILTINLYKNTKLMVKMRRAGFDTLFIGVESFDSNSLLETAKTQNVAAGVVGAIREIQSFGFPIIAGLIFGFDSDSPECFEHTLSGILDSGLLSGDPSMLTALPGTPLYKRMSLAGRIRDNKYGLGGFKYSTNIKYLQPRDQLANGYVDFTKRVTDGTYQFARLRAFFCNIEKKGNYIPLPGSSYFSLKLALINIRHNPKAFSLTLTRLWVFINKPSNVWYLIKAWRFVASKKHIDRRFIYLNFWLAVWTTMIVKYGDIKESDLHIESIAPEDINAEAILPPGYEEDRDEPIPENKIRSQRRETIQSLQRLVHTLSHR